MDAHDDTRLPWEAPAALPLTDSDSRADIVDVAMRNGGNGPVSLVL